MSWTGGADRLPQEARSCPEQVGVKDGLEPSQGFSSSYLETGERPQVAGVEADRVDPDSARPGSTTLRLARCTDAARPA